MSSENVTATLRQVQEAQAYLERERDFLRRRLEQLDAAMTRRINELGQEYQIVSDEFGFDEDTRAEFPETVGQGTEEDPIEFYEPPVLRRVTGGSPRTQAELNDQIQNN